MLVEGLVRIEILKTVQIVQAQLLRHAVLPADFVARLTAAVHSVLRQG